MACELGPPGEFEGSPKAPRFSSATARRRGSRGLLRPEAASDHRVDDAVLLRSFGGHEVIALHIALAPVRLAAPETGAERAA
jgi:hypothetical protein